MTAQDEQSERGQDEQKKALNKRLEAVSWALFLIMIGGLWLAPSGQVPESAWLFGVGFIMLGLNAARYLNGIKMSGFTIVLGILALALGLSDVLGFDLPVFPIVLILIGLGIILEAVFKKKGS